jgi:hypothetical protein
LIVFIIAALEFASGLNIISEYKRSHHEKNIVSISFAVRRYCERDSHMQGPFADIYLGDLLNVVAKRACFESPLEKFSDFGLFTGMF